VKNAWEALFLMLNSNVETLIRWGRGLLLNMICGFEMILMEEVIYSGFILGWVILKDLLIW
jgi:hypothetical protein